MLVIIFSYEREEMLKSLLAELINHEVIVIDDGSKWIGNTFRALNLNSFSHSIIETNHEGKQGFWKKWVMARQIALGSNHDHFLMIPDDVSKLDLETIKAITKQGWEDALFAVNIINCGRKECWGSYYTGQAPIEVNGVTLDEVGFVDCGFLTNRHTLTHIDIHEVPQEWFDRDDKSSGVGYQMSTSMRLIGTRMMMPREGLCYHGDHTSVMHGAHRKDVPLKSINK